MREAERGVAKLWGDRRILQELHAKGYAAEHTDAVLAYLRGEDSIARCRTLLRRRVGEWPEEEKERRRVLSMLSRYGYTPDEIAAALRGARKR